MTEQEWLECTDPIAMLSYLQAGGNDRKALLFIIACMARIWERITEQGHEWVEVAERIAEGQLDPVELSYHHDEVGESGLEHAHYVASPAEKGVVHAVMEVFYGVWYSPANFWGRELADAGVSSREEEKQAQATLLRDIFGNPFCPAALDPAWLTPTVKALALAAYRDRTLPPGTLERDRLAVLADALEDAGCTDTDILGHLRGPGPHVRGCRALDLLLGKK
jgi:hypothetical protein